MNWYYVIDGKQCGPVDDQQLETLAAGGNIGADTLVWREGMTEWQSYSSVKGGGGAAVATVAGQCACTECGRVLPQDEVVRHGNSLVCAACKPIFLQKLKEGVRVRGVMMYAGFWLRFGAKFLDGLILRVVGMATGMLIGLVVAAGEDQVLTIVVTTLVDIAINATYCTFFIGKFGATPGKMAAKIRVVNADGTPVGYGKACGRYFAEILSAMTLMIGYIMAGFDEEKRALHDRICNTRVIKN